MLASSLLIWDWEILAPLEGNLDFLYTSPKDWRSPLLFSDPFLSFSDDIKQHLFSSVLSDTCWEADHNSAWQLGLWEANYFGPTNRCVDNSPMLVGHTSMILVDQKWYCIGGQD